MLQGSGVGGVRPLASYEGFTHETARYRQSDVAKLRDMVRQGLRLGWSRCVERRNGVMRWEVNSAGECERPVVAHFRGVELPLPGSRFPLGCRAYLVCTVRRCRQCEWCRRMRSAHWAHRAVTQYERSARTWLGTITLSGFEHARLDAAVAAKAQETGAFWQTEWSPRDYFRERCEVFGQWLSLWLKRIREADQRRRNGWHDGCMPDAVGRMLKGRTRRNFSYMLVAEMHKNGRPHWHVLLHEDYAFALIRPDEYYVTQKGVIRVDEKAMIRKSWQFGFTQFELCRDSRSAGYLCKYLAKDMLWRVRASEGYGEPSEIAASVASIGATLKERQDQWTSSRSSSTAVEAEAGA